MVLFVVGAFSPPAAFSQIRPLINDPLPADSASRPVDAQARQSLDFADALFEWQDYPEAGWEYARFIMLYPQEQQGWAAYRLGLSLFRQGRYERVLAALQRHQTITEGSEYADQAGLLSAFAAAEMQQWTMVQELSNNQAPSAPWDVLRIYSLIANRQYDLAQDILLSYPDQAELSRIDRLITDYKPKSPVAAAALSSLIPGLGKFYTSQWADGLFSLASVGGLAGATAYSFWDKGIDDWHGWAYGAGFLVAYVANIVGSYNSAIRINHHQEAEIHNEAFNTYNMYRP
ncbi:MAG: hypothetical protein D6B26_00835 [Spirochaetaceae bacterium]|nr:MAG: hypothetical protein D6B26_00835 [Spirochaetaceae bacterium]